jgi:hypothetical protein
MTILVVYFVHKLRYVPVVTRLVIHDYQIRALGTRGIHQGDQNLSLAAAAAQPQLSTLTTAGSHPSSTAHFVQFEVLIVLLR